MEGRSSSLSLSLSLFNWSMVASALAQMVKNLSAVQETWVRTLGWEDALEEGMATHSNTLA